MKTEPNIAVADATLPLQNILASDAARQIPTPALVVDGSVARQNIQRMADYVKQHALLLRPHIKTHKSTMLARLQLTAGAIGLTVAKVGEAEAMAETTPDLLMAYPTVDAARCDRLARMARTRTVRVALDTVEAATALAGAARAAGSTIGVLVELDTGFRRTGVATPADSLALARLVAREKGLRLDGVLCFPGQIRDAGAWQAPQLLALDAMLQETLALWAKDGLPAMIVAGGTTPTAYQSHLVKSYTEIHPGTYVFNDLNTLRSGNCAPADCAAAIVCTVVSNAVKNQVILDGGTKVFTSDLCVVARDSGHGMIVEYPAAKIQRLSEEHGVVDVSLCSARPKVGERVTVVPNHICPCVNLQDAFWWIDRGEVARRIPVDARGRLS